MAEAFADEAFGLLRWASLGNGDITSRKLVAVQFPQSCRRQFRAGHGDERVASRLPCGGIEFQLDLGDSADPGKEDPELGFSDVRREVAYV